MSFTPHPQLTAAWSINWTSEVLLEAKVTSFYNELVAKTLGPDIETNRKCFVWFM